MDTPTTAVPLGHYIIQRGWHYAEFAKLIDIRASSLADIASGRRCPQRTTRKAISKALGITNDELVDMLEASAALYLASEVEQRLSRTIAEVRRLTRRIKKPAAVVVAVARAGRASLLSLIRRHKRKVIIVARKPGQQNVDNSISSHTQAHPDAVITKY